VAKTGALCIADAETISDTAQRQRPPPFVWDISAELAPLGEKVYAVHRSLPVAALMNALAHPLDDLMELLGKVWPLGYLPREREGGGVE
jgi:hypothetical protein